MPTRLSVF